MEPAVLRGTPLGSKKCGSLPFCSVFFRRQRVGVLTMGRDLNSGSRIHLPSRRQILDVFRLTHLCTECYSFGSLFHESVFNWSGDGN